jgi:FolB domain-containing protein
MDRIHLAGIVCTARLGISEQERSAPQRLSLDVDLGLDLEAAANTDDLALSVDYQRLVERLQDAAAEETCRLLETLAHRLCRVILESPAVRSVQLTLRKYPQALQGRLDHVAVEMIRDNR